MVRKREILEAINLLLATNTFSREELKNLANYGEYDWDSLLMKRLESMFNAYLEEGKLLHDAMEPLFPYPNTISMEQISVFSSGNMLGYARFLAGDPDNDVFLVYPMIEPIAEQMIREFEFVQNDAVDIFDSICTADPEWLYDNCGYQIEHLQECKDDFVAAFGRLILNLQRSLISAKIASGRTSRPLANIRTEKAQLQARADFLSDQSFVSLHTLGEILAMLYPIILVSLLPAHLNHLNSLNYDFRDFIEKLRLHELVLDYVDYARAMLPGNSVDGLYAQLKASPIMILTQDNFSCLTPYCQGIAQNLYEDFFAE